MVMNAKQYKYVYTLAQEGSFSRAADTLGISQPSLSQYIKKIECEIGADLFERTNGEVRITDAGRIFVDAGRKIQDIEHRMANAIADLAAFKTGSLIVGTSPYRAAGMLPLAAAAFHRIHPGMHLVVREGTTVELQEGIEHGEYDLALTLLPVDLQEFQYKKVAEEELILAVPCSFEAFPARMIDGRRFPAVDPKVLQGKPVVMLTDTQYMQRQLDRLIRDNQLQVQTAAVVKSLEAQIEMVKVGVGLALMPCGIEHFCRESEVTFYSLAQVLPKREVVAMWRREQPLSKAAESFLSVLQTIAW